MKNNLIDWNKYSWYCYNCHFFVSTIKCAKCLISDPNLHKHKQYTKQTQQHNKINNK